MLAKYLKLNLRPSVVKSDVHTSYIMIHILPIFRAYALFAIAVVLAAVRIPQSSSSFMRNRVKHFRRRQQSYLITIGYHKTVVQHLPTPSPPIPRPKILDVDSPLLGPQHAIGHLPPGLTYSTPKIRSRSPNCAKRTFLHRGSGLARYFRDISRKVCVPEE
jgi:hypothetical protein